MSQTKPSKSERKRRQQDLQRLGEQLIELGDELEGLALPERLDEAIREARGIKSREALRRQKQFIGKLMRDVDPAPIEALLDRLRADDRRDKRVFAQAERWRERILADREDALDAFAAATGAPNPGLGRLLDDLERASTDRQDREIRKRIFRVIHATLVARSRDG